MDRREFFFLDSNAGDLSQLECDRENCGENKDFDHPENTVYFPSPAVALLLSVFQ